MPASTAPSSAASTRSRSSATTAARSSYRPKPGTNWARQLAGWSRPSDDELQAATIRRDQARTDVETIKAKIEQQKDIAEGERDSVRAQIQSQVQNDVRASIRDAVKN